MRGLAIFTARYAGTCRCGGPIIRGDTVAKPYGRQGILCPRCTRVARGQEATALDHRVSAARAGHATKPPPEPIDGDT